LKGKKGEQSDLLFFSLRNCLKSQILPAKRTENKTESENLILFFRLFGVFGRQNLTFISFLGFSNGL